jgi:hypothetical protein
VSTGSGLFLEEVVEGLSVAVGFGRCGSAPLFFNQDLGLEERAKIVGTLVGYPYFDGLPAFVPCRRIEVQAIATSMKVGPAVLALVVCLDLVYYLDLRGAVVAPRDEVETRLYAPAHALGSRGRLGFPLAVTVLVTGLTILSIHRSPSRNKKIGPDVLTGPCMSKRAIRQPECGCRY